MATPMTTDAKLSESKPPPAPTNSIPSKRSASQKKATIKSDKFNAQDGIKSEQKPRNKNQSKTETSTKSKQSKKQGNNAKIESKLTASSAEWVPKTENASLNTSQRSPVPPARAKHSTQKYNEDNNKPPASVKYSKNKKNEDNAKQETVKKAKKSVPKGSEKSTKHTSKNESAKFEKKTSQSGKGNSDNLSKSNKKNLMSQPIETGLTAQNLQDALFEEVAVPTILMVAEKPSIASSIAKSLSSGQYKVRSGKTPIHEFQGEFQQRKCVYRVTSVTGHMYSCDFPPEYSNWDVVDPASLFHATTVKKLESNGLQKQLQSEAKGAHACVLWLDCDREGENICFEVIGTIHSKLKKSNRLQIPIILRAKFSAVNASDIRKALQYSNLVLPNENDAHAVDVRQELDLKVGVAFSRFQTKYFQGRYGDLDSALVSYGPCQTPTLGFCVDRHDEIQNFKPKSFWTIDMEISKNGHAVSLEWGKTRLFEQEKVHGVHDKLLADGKITVTQVKTSESTRPRPTPLNTVQLLQHASKSLGMGPYTAMQVAERLYLQGFISYPRTESTAYPASYNIQETLNQHAKHQYWGAHVCNLLQTGFQRPKQGIDVGDHPPITPVRSAQPSELSGDMERLYEFITRYFIATVSPDAKLLATKVVLSCAGEEFRVSGHQVLSKGFTEILTTSTSLSDILLPEFKQGEVFPIHQLRIKSGRTSPPGYLTESELIGLMEKHGIGTDASIPAHINNICERNYVTLGRLGRTLVPTSLGITLVHGYYKIDRELVLPKIRASIEDQCTLVAKGKVVKSEVLDSAISLFYEKFQSFVRNIELMDILFNETFTPLEDTGKPLSKCGDCLRYMKYISSRPQRLHCAQCEKTYNLPQNGTIKLYKELRCPLDQFELVLFSLGNSTTAMGKSSPICPKCYNDPPFENWTGGNMGCDSCIEESCIFSVIANGVFPCPGSIESGTQHKTTKNEEKTPCSGTMVLDINSKPNWKMACNSCHLLIKFTTQPKIHSIKTLKSDEDSLCESCGATLLEFTFHKDKSPLLNGATTYSGCILCDDFLSTLSELKNGRHRHIGLVRSRGRGRGRGKGRGRGRHSRKPVRKGGLLSVEEF